jgi:hypothetical protein
MSYSKEFYSSWHIGRADRAYGQNIDQGFSASDEIGPVHAQKSVGAHTKSLTDH